MGIVFRRAELLDADALSELVIELGQRAPLASVRARLGRLLAEPDQAVFVAQEGATVLAWLHVQEFLSLASDPCGLVTGLVVASSARRRGLGRGLMARAEAWARARGLDALRLRSRVSRVEAHGFYRSLGFEMTRKQLQFRKSL